MVTMMIIVVMMVISLMMIMMVISLMVISLIVRSKLGFGPDDPMISSCATQEGETKRSFWLADTDADEEGR